MRTIRAFLAFAGLLILAACATGDPAKDCLNATTGVVAAEIAATAAEAEAAAAPKSEALKQVAIQARIAVGIAQLAEQRLCAPPPPAL